MGHHGAGPPSSARPPRCRAHSAHAGGGEGAAARAARRCPARRLDAAMELFDHAAVERRYSVEPHRASSGGRARSARSQDRYRRPRHRRSGARSRREALARARASRAATSISIITDVVHRDHDPVARRLPRRRRSGSAPTCAGCRSPSSAARAARRRWRARTTSWSGFPDARALVIAVELPSLSMQRADLSPANLVSTRAVRRRRGGGGARRCARRRTARRRACASSRRWRTSSRARPTRWASICTTTAFTRVLSKDVPALLKSEIARAGADAGGAPRARRASSSPASCSTRAAGRSWASSRRSWGCARDDTQPSWDVLRDYGNQSSASVLFVLHEWLTQAAAARRRARHAGGVRPGPDRPRCCCCEWS